MQVNHQEFDVSQNKNPLSRHSAIEMRKRSKKRDKVERKQLKKNANLFGNSWLFLSHENSTAHQPNYSNEKSWANKNKNETNWRTGKSVVRSIFCCHYITSISSISHRHLQYQSSRSCVCCSDTLLSFFSLYLFDIFPKSYKTVQQHRKNETQNDICLEWNEMITKKNWKKPNHKKKFTNHFHFHLKKISLLFLTLFDVEHC